MDRDAWNLDPDSVQRALDHLLPASGGKVVREAFYGTRRFDDFATRVGITEAVAAKRLRELVEAGLLQRVPYQDPGQRTREEYLLTPMGRDLVPAALALMQWGDTYLADQPGGPLALRHGGCGAGVSVEVRCTEGHDVALEDISVRVNRKRRS